MEALLNENFIIQDNWPLEAPDIAKGFRDWLVQTIAKLKIEKLQKGVSKQKKLIVTNTNIFGSILSNPWTITIVDGLTIAFFAKLFGWI